MTVDYEKVRAEINKPQSHVFVVPEDSGAILGHEVVTCFLAIYNELETFTDPAYRAGVAMDLTRIVLAGPLAQRLMR